MSARVEFKAKLVPAGRNGASCFLQVPFDVEKTFGSRARVPVVGTINGFKFRSSIMPWEGGHVMCINHEMREGAQTRAGDVAYFVMEPDNKPRTVAVPAAMKRALAAVPAAKAAFEKLSYTHRKEYVQWITSAKKPETLARRLEKMIGLLAKKSKGT